MVQVVRIHLRFLGIAPQMLLFSASLFIAYDDTYDGTGAADPHLDVVVHQMDADGNQIDGGLLDKLHPRTEWKNPVRNHVATAQLQHVNLDS